MQKYRQILPNISLPPEPVITRWGTWINAALFYGEHFDDVKEVVAQLDPHDASCIAAAQRDFDNNSVFQNITMIKAHFKTIPMVIEKL